MLGQTIGYNLRSTVARFGDREALVVRSQSFRCTTCGAKFRRMPLLGKCTECQNELIQTVTRGAVEKYLGIATGMCQEYKINDYLRSRVESIATELKLIFNEQKQKQSSLTDFI